MALFIFLYFLAVSSSSPLGVEALERLAKISSGEEEEKNRSKILFR